MYAITLKINIFLKNKNPLYVHNKYTNNNLYNNNLLIKNYTNSNLSKNNLISLLLPKIIIKNPTALTCLYLNIYINIFINILISNFF